MKLALTAIRLCLFGGSLCLSSGTVFGQGWSSQNFSTNVGYVRGSGVISTFQPADVRWQGNDLYNSNTALGETDLIARANGYTPSPLANSSLIQGGLGVADGVLPGTNNVQIWKTFGALGSSTVSFFAEWSIIGSTLSEAPYTNSDTFSFDLRNAANTESLLSLQFTPGINILSNAYTLQTFAAGSPTGTIIDLGYGSLFQMQVDITGSTYDLSLARIDPTTRATITNFVNLASGNLSTGTAAGDLGTLGLNWVLASGDNLDPGSNYIIVNEVSVVPEPSTYVLLSIAGVALLALAVRRRRA